MRADSIRKLGIGLQSAWPETSKAGRLRVCHEVALRSRACSKIEWQPGPLSCSPHLIGERAIGERLGKMHAADGFRSIEVRKRTGNPQHTVIAAC